METQEWMTNLLTTVYMLRSEIRLVIKKSASIKKKDCKTKGSEKEGKL